MGFQEQWAIDHLFICKYFCAPLAFSVSPGFVFIYLTKVDVMKLILSCRGAVGPGETKYHGLK